MQENAKAGHHPLPGDERARHDLIPESVEDERDKGDDSPGDAPSETERPSAIINIRMDHPIAADPTV